MSYRNIGVDLSVTAKHKAQVRDETGKKIVSTFSFYPSKEDLDTLCQKALAGAEQGVKLRFICEPTEMSWFPLAIYAKTNDHELARVKSHQAHDLRKYFSRHKKNDKLDAGVLTVMPMITPEAIEQVYLPGAQTFALQRHNRQKEKITDQITAIKNRLSSLYHWVMPGLLDCFENHFGSRALEFYRRFTNPFTAKDAGVAGIREVLEPAGREKMEEDLPDKIYSVVLSACELYSNASSYVNFNEIQDEVNIELEILEAQEEVLAKVKDRVKDLYNKLHPSKIIESLKGISENLGPSLFATIADPNRFSSQSKLRCFSGMIPKQDDSGETNKKGLPITQEGPSRFRRDIFLAADVARQWDPQAAKIYFEGMVNKGHCHTQSVCAVASRLLNRLLCVLKEERPYELRDPEGNPISPQEAKQMIKQQFTVPEEIRKRTRSKRNKESRKNRKEERIRNLFKRQHNNAPQNSYNIPPKDIIQKFGKLCKSTS